MRKNRHIFSHPFVYWAIILTLLLLAVIYRFNHRAAGQAQETVPQAKSNVYLPLVELAPTPTPTNTPLPTPTATATPPIHPGLYQGITAAGKPVSFRVSEDGQSVLSFALYQEARLRNCVGEIVMATPGPLVISSTQFSGTVKPSTSAIVGISSFQGRFTSPTSASGTYDFRKFPSSCGFITVSGTWNVQQ